MDGIYFVILLFGTIVAELRSFFYLKSNLLQ